MEQIKEILRKKRVFISRLQYLFYERSIFLEFREIAIIFSFEFKRMILTIKFFVALSLVLLPAIIFLNSISSEYEALILDMGISDFQKFSATGFTIIGQFLLMIV
ncbi:MAG: hypothetical protein ACTSQB_07505 [Candidatus Heimdallarchaeota archaeon]